MCSFAVRMGGMRAEKAPRNYSANKENQTRAIRSNSVRLSGRFPSCCSKIEQIEKLKNKTFLPKCSLLEQALLEFTYCNTECHTDFLSKNGHVSAGKGRGPCLFQVDTRRKGEHRAAGRGD